MNDVMYLYSIPPIDFGWECLIPFEEFLGHCPRDFRPLVDGLSKALKAAEAHGWKGDFNEANVRLFFLPDDNEFTYGFAWKQSQAGTTFIASPRPLPWLAAMAY